MRILFYLPLARGWMIENVLGPMIAKLAPLAEVHVMLPPAWIERFAMADDLALATWRSSVCWHPLQDEPDATNGPAPGTLDAVAAIAPDHCLCRSIDPTLPRYLPGKVRYVMEASAPPFRLPTHWVSLQPQIFDHGLMPSLASEERATLTALIAPTWVAIEQENRPDPEWRVRHNLPDDRSIVALPLDYEHADNFFGMHRSIRPNAALVADLVDRIDARIFIAITDHPLNVRRVDQANLVAALASRAEKALLMRCSTRSDVTNALAQHADGMIIGDSKSFATAAFYSTPLLRFSKFASGAWLQAYNNLNDFATDIASGKARAADRRDAMVWFSHYLAAEAFAPREEDVTGAELLERIVGGIQPERWSNAFARVERLQRGKAGLLPA